MRGRKPKPTRLKVVSGNPGGRKLNENEPKPTAWLSAAPDWFDEMQAQYWDDAIESAPRGLLGTMDRDVLAVWVTAAVLHRRSTEAQLRIDAGKSTPFLTKTPNGMAQQSPYISIINKQAQVMLKAAAELGFTPSSRSRISVGAGVAEGNDFEGL